MDSQLALWPLVDRFIGICNCSSAYVRLYILAAAPTSRQNPLQLAIESVHETWDLLSFANLLSAAHVSQAPSQAPRVTHTKPARAGYDPAVTMEQALLSQRTQWRPRPESEADAAVGRNEGSHEDDEVDFGDDDGDDENRVRQGGNNRKVQRRRRSGGQRRRLHFEISELQQLYHMPLKTAAERLGICEAALKRICRRNQIRKWPYRQLQSIRRRMTDIEDQENSRPSNNTTPGSLDNSCSQHSHDEANGLAKNRSLNEPPRSSFLLPHEMQYGLAPFDETSEDVLPKREKLALLEEERQRVIRLAHLTSKARQSNSGSVAQDTASSHAAIDGSLTFEELLSWSVPVYDSLQDDGSTYNSVQGCHASSMKDSALLLLANVCSNEDKIRELHARRLIVRRPGENWQRHGVKALAARFTLTSHTN